MPQRPDSRSENALILALVLVGVALLVALILVLIGAFREGASRNLVWYGVGLVVLSGVVDLLIFSRVRKLRRERRPEWLETQAWHQGMVDQVKKGQQRSSGPADQNRER